MEFLGLKLNADKNVDCNGKEHDISADDARVRVWIVPTNEELTIARDTMAIVSKG